MDGMAYAWLMGSCQSSGPGISGEDLWAWVRGPGHGGGARRKRRLSAYGRRLPGRQCPAERSKSAPFSFHIMRASIAAGEELKMELEREVELELELELPCACPLCLGRGCEERRGEAIAQCDLRKARQSGQS